MGKRASGRTIASVRGDSAIAARHYLWADLNIALEQYSFFSVVGCADVEVLQSIHTLRAHRLRRMKAEEQPAVIGREPR